MGDDDFISAMSDEKELSTEQQQQMGKAVAGAMGDEHKTFLKTVIELLDLKGIDLTQPETLLNKEVYDQLDELEQGKVDLALINIVDQLIKIEEFYRSADTPDESPQLQNMIEALWQSKKRIEENYDVFKI